MLYAGSNETFPRFKLQNLALVSASVSPSKRRVNAVLLVSTRMNRASRLDWRFGLLCVEIGPVQRAHVGWLRVEIGPVQRAHVGWLCGEIGPLCVEIGPVQRAHVGWLCVEIGPVQRAHVG
eukprot:1196234-Prorocentrum_minimum.AAC.5